MSILTGDVMEVWGLILNGVGAVLVAAGQEDVNGSIRLWLWSAPLTVDSFHAAVLTVCRAW